jgi:hypothetical protein
MSKDCLNIVCVAKLYLLLIAKIIENEVLDSIHDPSVQTTMLLS